MPAASNDRRRYERYLAVAEAAAAREAFALYELKAACQNERPVFVTRVVSELEKAGWLVRSGQKRRPAFRWAEGRRASFCPSGWADRQVYGATIRRTPASDRPRERLLAHGAAALRTAELLAILIRSGRPGESALQAGEKIAARFADRLDQLPAMGQAELKAISSTIQPAAYCQIMAGVELGRRVAEAASQTASHRPRRITCPEEAVQECTERFGRLAVDGVQEEFHILTLNVKHEVVAAHRVSIGGFDASLVQPREVFRLATKDAACAVLLVHNHPSGDPTPSRDDLALTKRLEQAGELLGIQVLDHIILAKRGALSLRQHRQSGH